MHDHIVKGNNRNGHTMFPDNWSRRFVTQVINKAVFIARTKGTPVDLADILPGEYYRGIKIGFQVQGNKLKSAYPILP